MKTIEQKSKYPQSRQTNFLSSILFNKSRVKSFLINLSIVVPLISLPFIKIGNSFKNFASFMLLN